MHGYDVVDTLTRCGSVRMGSTASELASRSSKYSLHGNAGQNARDLAAPVTTGFVFLDPREYRVFRHFFASLCNLWHSR